MSDSAVTERPEPHPLDDDIVHERTLTDLLGGDLGPGDVIAEKYRLEELIGQGAMGFVVRARHLQLDEPVAVKFLLPELGASPEALLRFEREARAAFKIKSEHVGRVLDVDRLPSGQPFMVMEFLDGEDLGTRIYGNQIPIDELADLMLQACDAVAEAHSLGIVHRDIKPENLFLIRRRDGSTAVKVLDFGLSKVVPRTSAPAPRQRAVTADAQVLGTAHYMSPEQWVASRDVGPPSDIWALGVILYEGITGESPFIRNNLAAMCNAVLREDPPAIDALRPDTPPALIAVVERCLRKEAGDRYASVRELAEALLPFAPRDAKPPARFSSPPAPPPPPPDSKVAVSARPSQRRLGLKVGEGIVESWTSIMEDEPAAADPRHRIAVAVAVALGVLVLAYLLS